MRRSANLWVKILAVSAHIQGRSSKKGFLNKKIRLLGLKENKYNEG